MLDSRIIKLELQKAEYLIDMSGQSELMKC